MPEIKPKAKRGRPRKVYHGGNFSESNWSEINEQEQIRYLQKRLSALEDNIEKIIQVVDDLRWKGRGDVRWLKLRHPILSWKIHRDVKKRNTYKE